MFNFPIPFIAFYHFTFSFCFWVTAGSVTGNNTFPMSTAVKTEFWRLFATAVTPRKEEEATRLDKMSISSIIRNQGNEFFRQACSGKISDLQKSRELFDQALSRYYGIRSFRSMVRSFQVRSFQSVVRSFHKIVSSFHKIVTSFHIRYIYFLNV